MSLTYAKAVGDTVHPEVPSARITTIEYQAPRLLLAEINTHGVIAKSAASSRAIPVEKRLQFVRETPFVPTEFGKNERGMQARSNIEGPGAAECFKVWVEARDLACMQAQKLVDLGVHKQHANRILEPYAYVRGVITATEWDNFFNLRLSEEAQPEFEELAREIDNALRHSVPITDKIHRPYIGGIYGGEALADEETMLISAARCARVSYKLFDGAVSNITKDGELCVDLIKKGHMSPFDHPAVADNLIYDPNDKTLARWGNPTSHGRFWGWVPMRSEIERQMGRKSRRSSFDPLRVDENL